MVFAHQKNKRGKFRLAIFNTGNKTKNLESQVGRYRGVSK